MALCIDVVLNHTAREHAWAQAALAGDARPLAFYRTFPDRSEPDAYERTLPDVFPDTAPGNFTWEPALGRWVWTTFNAYQWDLDYTNPEVFGAMAEAMLALAAAGRRRAAPRRRAVPVEAHGHELPEPARGPRAAAGVPRGSADRRARGRLQGGGDRRAARPRRLPRRGRHEGKECDLAYHNVLMVLLWSALASGRVALMTQTLRAMPPVPPGAGWVTYVRCHDDIGWAITEEDAGRASARTPTCTAASWSDFYAGDFPGQLRARRALPARPAAPARRARAARPRRWPGSRRRSSAATRWRSSWRCAGSCCSTRSRSPTAACR